MWSDPKEGLESPYWEKSKRGKGIYFDKQITQTFLKKHNFDYLIRSHEKVDEGYEILHEKRLITIFSASYYSGSSKNKGAVIVFDEHMKEPRFKQWKVKKNINIDEKRKEETLKMIKEKIFVNKEKLYSEFAKKDQEKNGYIPKKYFVRGFKTVFELKIEWENLLEYLAKYEDNGEINYIKFLNQFKINFSKEFEKKFNEEIVQKVCLKIVKNFNNLDLVFKKFDKNSDNMLSYDEFFELLISVDLNLTKDQIFDFILSCDLNKNGSIGIIKKKKLKKKKKVKKI
jgi:serine/threonine-protein phosphatase with EF-hands